MRSGAFLCGVLAAIAMATLHADDRTLVVWKIGSPHYGDTPKATVPRTFTRAAASRGYRVEVRAFKAEGFAATYREALQRGAAPDVLVFDNFGVIDGMTTERGRFEGIGEEPDARKKLVRVTGTFDDLLPPTRGWTYLITSSANYLAARNLALKPPTCTAVERTSRVDSELDALVTRLGAAYLERNSSALQDHADPDALPSESKNTKAVSVRAVNTCGLWGNQALAFASLNMSYEAETAIGQLRVVMVLRNRASRWQLLTATRDPVSNDEFVKAVPALTKLLVGEREQVSLPAPARLTSTAAGEFPPPAAGERFGHFEWRASRGGNVIAEIVEFAYDDNARLFLMRPGSEFRRISTGRLWTTRGFWWWRVWSVTRSGDVVFSESRSFLH